MKVNKGNVLKALMAIAAAVTAVIHLIEDNDV